MNRNELTKIIKESIISYFYESLNSQKQKYGDDLVNKLLSLDPSKNYKYIEQICNYYNEGISEKEIKEYIDLYDEKLTKNLIPKEYSNINNIKSFDDLKDIVDNKSQEVSHAEAKTNLMKEAYVDTITTDKGTFDVYRPYNTLQSIQIGKHTKWCIAQTSLDDENYFNQYFVPQSEELGENKRFYIFVKNNNEKYQMILHPNGKKRVWNIEDKQMSCAKFKELTDIDCSNYDWYPINEYVKDITVYDKLGHKMGHIINNMREGEWRTYNEYGGELAIIQHFKHNKYDGEETVYDDGKVIGHNFWKNGVLIKSDYDK